MLTNDEFIHRDFIRGNPRLNVCFAMATEAHAAKKRRNGLPYIEHPTLVCNLVDAFGGSDEQKAVALLHDVIEENEEYKAKPRLLKIKLIKALNDECHPATQAERDVLKAWAEQVYRGVDQLSLNKYRVQGSKRVTQVDAVESIDEPWRLVKIFDQAASVIGDILYSNPRDEKELKNNRTVALKGWDVSRECCGDNPAFPPYDFYNRVFNQFRDYYKASLAHRWEEVKEIRKNFSFEQAITDSLNPEMMATVKPERVEIYYAPFLKSSASATDRAMEKSPFTLAHVTVSKETGRVVSYGLVVSPNETEEAPANNIAAKIRKELERKMTVGVATGDLQDNEEPRSAIRKSIRALLTDRGIEDYSNTVQVRNYKLTGPVGIDRLIKVTKRAGGSIDRSFEEELRNIVRSSHQDRGGRARA